MTYQELALSGLGNQTLMSMPKVAFFASRQCPGSAISAAMDWAVQQSKAKQTVISGFHSPLEQSVLTVLLQAKSPVVVALARPLERAKLPSSWQQALSEGSMAVVSRASIKNRLTQQLAAQRNDLVAQLAQDIVIAHASEGGLLSKQANRWCVHYLSPSIMKI
ncbi:MAG: DNA-processing protein DprA [Cytophagales bacterium]|nr:DNA-processing protein DprA [Cytophagales bacterium]